MDDESQRARNSSPNIRYEGESTRPRNCRSLTRLVCLNFKVPFEVRQKFKIYAAQKGITMTEALMLFLEDALSITPDHRGSHVDGSIEKDKTEIKKSRK